ncbi:YmfQ family protein [Anoxybacillus salavatliensis]|uniref:YmfQ family protein n=1 Tax=Anoxybacillus gonensis TaxID=198467 RepID=UPI00214BF453|nr:YmfQ family protein [Anoxybacillus gonensis]MCQ5366081.1 YmfQ family protein [Anoxybacillus gonensis]
MVDLFQYLPNYYDNIREFQELISAEEEEIGLLQNDIDELLEQFHIDTATWGLSYWERICGIPVDESKPIDQRRSVIKSELRGIGTVTVELVKNVAEAYYNGQVEVTEQPSIYTVKIKFVSKLGVPPNLADIQNALREIIPAHLAINFEFSYLLIRDIHNAMTLSQLQATTLDKFAGGA